PDVKPVKEVAVKESVVDIYEEGKVSVKGVHTDKEIAAAGVLTVSANQASLDNGGDLSKLIKRIGILTGGGPASGHNAVIYAAYIEAKRRSAELVGIFNGFDGLAKDELVAKARPLTYSEVNRSRDYGGTILGADRVNPYSDNNVKSRMPDKIWQNIQILNLDALITLGGDDTNTAGRNLSLAHGNFPVIGGSKTIDNDLALPDNAPTYGYHTWVTYATAQARQIEENARSTHRVIVVESFGRGAGFAPLGVGMSIGAARTLIPEVKVDFEELVEDIRVYYERFGYAMVVVSEGIKVDVLLANNQEMLDLALSKDPIASAYYGAVKQRDEFGHPKLEGAGRIIAAVLSTYLPFKVSEAEKIAYSSRTAQPVFSDMERCMMIGTAAVEQIFSGPHRHLLYFDQGVVKSIALDRKLGGRMVDVKGDQRIQYMHANVARMLREKPNMFDDPVKVEASIDNGGSGIVEPYLNENNIRVIGQELIDKLYALTDKELADKNLQDTVSLINSDGRLSPEQKKEITFLLEGLYQKASSYFSNDKENPLYHHTQVLYNMARIALGELELNEETAYAELRNLLILALLHDIGNSGCVHTKVVSKDIIKAFEKANQEQNLQHKYELLKKAQDLAKEGIAFRLEHMDNAPPRIVLLTEEYVNEGILEETDIHFISRAAVIHDYPTIENTLEEVRKAGIEVMHKRGKFLLPFADPAIGRMVEFLREADRLFMLSVQGVIKDLKSDNKKRIENGEPELGFTPENINTRAQKNIGNHEREYLLYKNSGQDDRKFHRSLYRTQTGYNIFKTAKKRYIDTSYDNGGQDEEELNAEEIIAQAENAANKLREVCLCDQIKSNRNLKITSLMAISGIALVLFSAVGAEFLGPFISSLQLVFISWVVWIFLDFLKDSRKRNKLSKELEALNSRVEQMRAWYGQEENRPQEEPLLKPEYELVPVEGLSFEEFKDKQEKLVIPEIVTSMEEIIIISMSEISKLEKKADKVGLNSDEKHELDMYWRDIARAALILSHFGHEKVEGLVKMVFVTPHSYAKGTALRALANVSPKKAATLAKIWIKEGEAEKEILNTCVEAIFSDKFEQWRKKLEEIDPELEPILELAGIDPQSEIVGQDREDIFRMAELGHIADEVVEVLTKLKDRTALQMIRRLIEATYDRDNIDGANLAISFGSPELIPVLKATLESIDAHFDKLVKKHNYDLDDPDAWSSGRLFEERNAQIALARAIALLGDKDYVTPKLKEWLEFHLKLEERGRDRVNPDYPRPPIYRIAGILIRLGEAEYVVPKLWDFYNVLDGLREYIDGYWDTHVIAELLIIAKDKKAPSLVDKLWKRAVADKSRYAWWTGLLPALKRLSLTSSFLNEKLAQWQDGKTVRHSSDACDVAKTLIRLREEAGIDHFMCNLVEPLTDVSNLRYNLSLRFEAAEALIKALRLDRVVKASLDNGGLPKVNPTATASWKKLKSLSKLMKEKHMKGMFSDDPRRFDKYSVRFGDILLDYSKNLINPEVMNALLGLANETGLSSAIKAMFTGEKI
ncbi:MAG: 6-phosphofructokinase, partial [Candidatus Omnitrophica bacterium]|nr:6-phosphofructokinase [Candidatus Omnitrophota bacterium]